MPDVPDISSNNSFDGNDSVLYTAVRKYFGALKCRQNN